ncbi:MAG: prepilin peptidase [Candidatus Omnitrophica bacterium]|nr:prepilin peptidase [Candidatus Omnitrophota bacterium]MDD5487628.1 prepilin peptidase [Candidatus Omnitrophota bacterium]
MEYPAVFLFGLILGSFLNVCIYRIPLNRSIVWPPSACPFCEEKIKWYDNIPVLSYLALGRKCRGCGHPISPRYAIVELLTAFTGMGLLSIFSLTPEFFVYWIFSAMLIIVVFVDIEYQEIPDVVSLPGVVVGLILMTVLRLDGSATYAGSFFDSLLGILAGGGSMFLLGVIGELIFRKEALGGGDVKLMAMIGAFLGWKLVIVTFFMAPFFGSVAGLIMKFKFKKDIIPYGPYLALAAIISLIFGERIIGFYFGF